MRAAPAARLSVEEYLAGEPAGELRGGEYSDGEVCYPMTSATWNHGVLTTNTSRRLAERLDGSCFRLSTSAVKVRISQTQFAVPDLVVVSGKPVFFDDVTDTITSLKLIVQVLSPSIRKYDGGLFYLYRQLPSFEEYVLIAQDRAAVQVRRKAPDGGWVMTFYEGLDSAAKLESLDIELPLAELYAGVDLDPAPTL